MFYKIENNKFVGFYSEDDLFHKDIIFDKDGNVNSGFFNIDDEKYQSILDSASSSNGEIFYNGETILFKERDSSADDMLNPTYIDGAWVDLSSHEEKTKMWKDMIMSISAEISNIERAGLSGSSDYIELQINLEKYKKKYIDSVHEMALEMDKCF